jgi:Tol biopolymer transport system component
VLPLEGDRKPMPYLNGQFNTIQGRFSPDGRFVAYTSNESGRNEVYVQPFPEASGGKWMVSKGGGSQPRWRRDGKELFYVSADSRLTAVEVSLNPAFQHGSPKALFHAPLRAATGNVTCYDVTADGKKFLVSKAQDEVTPAQASPITVVLNWTAGLRK